MTEEVRGIHRKSWRTVVLAGQRVRIEVPPSERLPARDRDSSGGIPRVTCRNWDRRIGIETRFKRALDEGLSRGVVSDSSGVGVIQFQHFEKVYSCQSTKTGTALPINDLEIVRSPTISTKKGIDSLIISPVRNEEKFVTIHLSCHSEWALRPFDNAQARPCSG